MKKRVLYVDDEEALVRATRLALEGIGQVCTGMLSPEEALERLQEEPHAFDMVIVEFRMPGMTGLEFARRVAEMCSDLPLVLCSGFLSEFIVHEGRELGIAEFLRKPVAWKDLIELLDRWFSKPEVSSESGEFASSTMGDREP